MSSQSSLILERIIGSALAMGATEVHLSAGSKPDVSHDGLREIIKEEEIITPEFLGDIVPTLIPEPGQQSLADRREARSVVEISGSRCKVHAYYQKGLLAITLHPIKSAIRAVEDLHIPETVTSWLGRRHGVILIAGPVGSGRTTLAAALIQWVNQTKVARIVTLEDPIETVFANQKSIIEQRQIKTDVATWQEGFDSLADEEIDIIYVSEIAGVEQAQGVMRLATAGRLMIGVMTASDAVDALAQWSEWFGTDQQARVCEHLAAQVIGVACVRRLARIGGGEMLVYEVLANSLPMATAIRLGEWKQVRSVLATSRGEGMVMLDRALAEAVVNGAVSKERAEAACIDANEFRRLARR